MTSGEITRPSWRRAALALGSNVDDRLTMLQEAVSRLGEVPGLRVVAVSPVFETDPVGAVEQPLFLNAVLIAETLLAPRELLGVALEVEAALGRVRTTRWGPRRIDIDVLVVGEMVVDDPDLQVPHPRAAERAFVLVPWARADASARMPDGTPVRELASLVASEGVRERADLTLELPAARGNR